MTYQRPTRRQREDAQAAGKAIAELCRQRRIDMLNQDGDRAPTSSPAPLVQVSAEGPA